ncbi:SagB-type dehydrogenase domain-containing protein [Paenibacillus tianmuensis]|uniref:SagB-type dehydrogenase domain-containing protein n=1 Tax=Paenibacillus tianmuensis TaxID=624147 RepID=A0A1G4SIB6_9BACL|nr:SagB/ThcOx family dehydrogenase [Paenibacillus tianmuensis]SCW68808.1 SagB-type dehydrogenase domain-containing protein [Paenibacillus tianmuensis]
MSRLNRYYLAPDLVITYPDGQPQLILPSVKRTFKVDWKVCEIISMFSSEDTSLQPIFSESMVTNIIDHLVKNGILIDKETDHNLAIEQIVAEWQDWDESSWFLHLQTKDTKFETTEEGRLQSVEKFRKITSPPPQYFKCNCTSSSIKLPTSSKLLDQTLVNSFMQRRTCRRFSEKPISLQNLADVLFYSGGILFTNDTHSYGIVAKKPSPSPGGRHATELYPIVNACEGLRSGVYHYCQKHHALHLIEAEEDVKPFLNEVLYGQDYFLNAAVTVFYTSVLERLKWKYKTSRVYRLMHLETGHYAQNFLLTGAALDLGGFVTAAFKDSVIEEKLGVCGIREVAMYVSGIGHIVPDETTRSDIEYAQVLPEGIEIRLPIGEHS